MKTSKRFLVLMAALLIGATGLLAQSTVTPPGMNPPTVRPNVNASDNAKAMQTLLKQFETQRDQFIAARKAMLDKLPGATEAERKKILDELHADQKARNDEQRALAKQIRDELKKLRDARKSGG